MKKHFSPIESTHRSIDNLAAAFHESDALIKHAIGREQIMERYWDLAGLSPSNTKGSVAGQLRT
jgi:hypothetical protein